MSQAARVLRKLEEAGERGVHSFDIYDMNILRPAAVVFRLKGEGHPIESEDEVRGEAKGCRYFLRPGELVVASSEPVDRGKSASSPYDAFGDWS